MSRLCSLALIVLAGLASTSCHNTSKLSRTGLPAHLPTLEESVVYVPVKIYARSFLAKAESMAPVTFTSPGWPAFQPASCDFQYKYRFIRSALKFSCVNNNVQVAMFGNYQIAGSKSICAFDKQVSPWISGSCGFAPENMRRIEIVIGSHLSFQPDGRLISRSALEKINPLDKCTVTLMNTDITSLITDSIRSSVNAFSTFLDRAVSELNYAGIIQNIANITGKKISLAGYGSLKLNASAIHVSKIDLSKDTIYFTAGFRCFPEISSDSINHQVSTFLPPLSETNERPGFRIHANTSYEYFFLDSLLTRFAIEHPFELEGRKVKIKEVDIRGLEGQRVEMKLQFTGGFKGTLFLTGTPVLDEKNQLITVPDLDYSLKSGDLLLNMGKTLYNKKIITLLRKKAVISVADLLQKNRNSLDSMMSRQISPYISSKGFIRNLRAKALVVNKDNLLFQLSAEGDMSLTVVPPRNL